MSDENLDRGFGGEPELEDALAAPVADRKSLWTPAGDGSGSMSLPMLAAGEAAANDEVDDEEEDEVDDEDEDEDEDWMRPRFGPLVLRSGFTLMNRQVLRSRVFQSPTLGVWLRALGDDSRYQFMVEGFSPGMQHLLLLLFAISRMRHVAQPQRGAVVRFTTRQLIVGLGWAQNMASYERAARLIDELGRVRLTFCVLRKRDYMATYDLEDFFQDGAGPRPFIGEAALFRCEAPTRAKGETCVWQAHLAPELLKLLERNENTLLELRACRALHTSRVALWLYGLIASQSAGLARTFNAKMLCRDAGLTAKRDGDNRKALARLLAVLQRGSALVGPSRAQSFQPAYAPILAKWSIFKGERGWRVTLTRSHAFTSVKASDEPGRAC